jgi:hypothetical protein
MRISIFCFISTELEDAGWMSKTFTEIKAIIFDTVDDDLQPQQSEISTQNQSVIFANGSKVEDTYSVELLPFVVKQEECPMDEVFDDETSMPRVVSCWSSITAADNDDSIVEPPLKVQEDGGDGPEQIIDDNPLRPVDPPAEAEASDEPKRKRRKVAALPKLKNQFVSKHCTQDDVEEEDKPPQLSPAVEENRAVVDDSDYCPSGQEDDDNDFVMKKEPLESKAKAKRTRRKPSERKPPNTIVCRQSDCTRKFPTEFKRDIHFERIHLGKTA